MISISAPNQATEHKTPLRL